MHINPSEESAHYGGYGGKACSCRNRAIPDKLVKASGPLLVIAKSQAGLGGAWDVFSVAAGGTLNSQFLTLESPIRGRVRVPIAHVNGDGVCLGEGNRKSSCENLDDEHWKVDDDFFPRISLPYKPAIRCGRRRILHNVHFLYLDTPPVTELCAHLFFVNDPSENYKFDRTRTPYCAEK
jgi:hypothetical protein